MVDTCVVTRPADDAANVVLKNAGVGVKGDGNWLFFESVQKCVVGYCNVFEANYSRTWHSAGVFRAKQHTAHRIRTSFIGVGVQRAKCGGVANVFKRLVQVQLL